MRILTRLMLITCVLACTFPVLAGVQPFQANAARNEIQSFATVEIDHNLLLHITGDQLANPAAADECASTNVRVSTLGNIRLFCPKITPLRGESGYTIDAQTMILLNGHSPATWPDPSFWYLNLAPGNYGYASGESQITLTASVDVNAIARSATAGTYTGTITLFIVPR